MNKKNVILLLFLLLLLCMLLTISTKEGFSNNIPKIIHQTAPSDVSKSSPLWHECQQTWKTIFPDYTYMMWSDEDLEKLIRDDYPFFLDTYMGYDETIKRVDMARYFILYKYGGVYADMDYKCLKRFELPSKVSIPESPFSDEYLHNSLMMSPVGDTFWMKVIEKGISRKDENDKGVLYQTGPNLVSATYFENQSMVNVLPKQIWNPPNDAPTDANMITRHLCTNTWRENKS